MEFLGTSASAKSKQETQQIQCQTKQHNRMWPCQIHRSHRRIEEAPQNPTYISPPRCPCNAAITAAERLMGRPAADGGRCKRHPKHRQSTGVCPFCLREKLAHLPHSASSSATSAAYFSSTSSASSSPISESDLSSYDPSPRASGGSRLTKSRSLVFAVRGRRRKEDKKVNKEVKEKEKEKVQKKKERFWSKLLSGPNRKQKEEAAAAVGGGGCGGLKHSQTFKEKPSARWI